MKIEIVQNLQQQQILAPQMILSMDILLLTGQELEARIEKEFMENPALEISESFGEALSPGELVKPPEDIDLIQKLNSFHDLPPLKFTETRRRRSSDSDFDKQEALQNLEGDRPGIREHLLEQLHLLDLPLPFNEIGEYIIHNIDDRGYLLHSAEVLRESTADRFSPSDFDRTLDLVRSLDPPGVAAESLQQCLLLQLERDPQDYPLETAILTEHVEDLEKNKIPKIARDLGKTVEEIKEALEIIASLEPNPGRNFAHSPTQFVRPDVVIELEEDHLRVKIQDSNIPDIRVSDTCKDLLKQSRGKKKITDFLRRKIDSAQWLIQAIQQRRETLRDITYSIIEVQRDFMKNGPTKLKAMKMQTIADRVGVHISTISRAIKGKYMQTPHGMFEMRYFFTGGVEREDGELESRRNIYRRIAELIDGEDKSKPLSDTAIARQLREEGLEIARRTVTKYRDQEKIPPSRLRREY